MVVVTLWEVAANNVAVTTLTCPPLTPHAAITTGDNLIAEPFIKTPLRLAVATVPVRACVRAAPLSTSLVTRVLSLVTSPPATGASPHG